MLSACSAVSNRIVRAVLFARTESRKGIMDSNILLLSQTFVDVMAWFLLPFAFMLTISWVVSFFRR